MNKGAKASYASSLLRFALVCLLILVMPCAQVAVAVDLDWPGLNRDLDAQRYLDLDQINKSNLKNLKPVCEARLNEPSWPH